MAPTKKKQTKLTPSQKIAFSHMTKGDNCFIYGEAGTGKSFLIEHFTKYCFAKNKHLLKTAFTGIASLHIKGYTLHRIFRPYLYTDVLSGKEPLEQSLIYEISKYDVIVIDEISMVRIDLFEYVSRVIFEAQRIKNKHIQIIVTGDFFQLPPVIPENDYEILRILQNVRPGGDIKTFAFESDYWSKYNFIPLELKENLRQEHDQVFVKYLNNIKTRSNVKETLAYFNKQAKTDYIANAKAIYIAASNKIVEEINFNQLKKIKKNLITSSAILTGEIQQGVLNNTIPDTKYPALLTVSFKKGCRIMFIRNNRSLGYKNGTFGTIIDCGNDNNTPWVYVLLDDGKYISFSLGDENTRFKIKKDVEIDEKTGDLVQGEYAGEFIQMPFKLGYAVTIHKAQGKTFEYVNFDPNEKGARSYEKGQLYVALSRVKTIDGLHLISKISESQLVKSDVVIDFYNSLNK